MEPQDPMDSPGMDREPAEGGRAPSVTAGLEALLDFYISAGADAWLEERPVDAFALSERPATRADSPGSASRSPVRSPSDAGEGQVFHQSDATRAPLRPAAPARTETRPSPPVVTGSGAVMPGDEAIVAAREAARTAATLDELRDTLARFDGCNLRLTAKSLVFADGPPDARLMLVGEAPGREEDLRGLPFVGRSGQLLDRMLEAIGLARDEVYITNVVPWRPPGNRTPSPQETEICKPFVQRQIELVRPRVLVFLGGASAKALTGAQDGILRLRGRWMELPPGPDARGASIRAVATLHPAYLLRNPLQKRFAWRDFLAVREALEATAADVPSS